MKKLVIISLALLSCLHAPASAQESMLASIMYLNGIMAEEDLGEELVERYESLSSHPVRINIMSENRLMGCGLFSRYQVASLIDYKRSYGDILSIAELALVDGFGQRTAHALEPFVSFESRYGTGARTRDSLVVKGESMVRAGVKESAGEPGLSYAMKSKISVSDALAAGVALKAPYTDHVGAPEAYSGSVAAYGNRLPGKLILGDFNARFGQGLIQWSGFSLSGFSSASSFAKHPSGLGPACTFSPATAYRGVAADLTISSLTFSAFHSSEGVNGANVSRYGRMGQLGVSALSEGLASVDFRYAVRCFDLFGELAHQFKDSADAWLLGMTYNHSYELKASVMVRSYPAEYQAPHSGSARASTKNSDERGVAGALDAGPVTLSLDAMHRPGKGTSQLKCRIDWNPELSESVQLRSRASFRLRPEDADPYKYELKLEGRLRASEHLGINTGASASFNKGFAWLAFAEASASSRKSALHIRGNIFVVDNWDDRIYMYERDLPGSFSVPAFYGRGMSLVSAASYRSGRLSLNAKASMLAYPLMKEEKPGKAELKFQARITF